MNSVATIAEESNVQPELIQLRGLRARAEAVAARVGAECVHSEAPPHQQLFRLARHLQGEVGIAAGDRETWQALVVWHRASCAEQRWVELDLDAAYAELTRCWDKIYCPVGSDPVTAAWESAQAEPLPPQSLRYESPRIRALVALCRQLEKHVGNVWWLACRSAARLLQCSAKTAAGLLRVLVRDGVLQRMSRGNAHKAIRYSMKGEQPEQPPAPPAQPAPPAPPPSLRRSVSASVKSPPPASYVTKPAPAPVNPDVVLGARGIVAALQPG